MKIDDVLTLLCLIFAIFAICYVIVRALRNDGGCCDGTDCDNCPFPRCHPQDQDDDME